MILLKNRDRKPNFKSGKYVEINDAGNYPMELSVDGVCEQNTTTGKNKLPNNATSKTLNGVTFTKNSDGTVVVNGTSTASCFYNIISDNEVPITTTNLILSGCPLGGTSSSYRLRATYTDTSYSEDIGNSIKLKNGKVLQIATIVITNGTTCNNLTFKPMISSDGGEYEPYTGGQPSPSPDYPQEIKTITGNIKVTSCGKNLFDKDNANILNLYPSLTFGSNKLYQSICISIKPNTTYTLISLNHYSEGLALGTSKEYPVAGGTVTNKTRVDKTKNNVTITSGANDKYLLAYIKWGTSISEEILDGIQIEKGSIATEYEPYQGSSLNITIPSNEFVGKLDDTYKDTLNVVYKDDGQYHLILNKMVGKIVFDGSERGWLSFKNENNIWNYYIHRNDISKNVMYCLSNYFVYRKLGNNLIGEFQIGGYIGAKNGNILFNPFNDTINNINKFKTWLSTHNTEVYYPLATPYEVDLGIVDTLLSYDKITNIFTDSDLYPVINVKYYKYFKFDKILRSGYNIDEKEYEIAKKQMANGKRKRILSSYDDCIIKINLGLLDNKTYQEYKEQLDDGEFHYWSYKYNQYKKANFILTKPSITTEYAYDDDIGINDMEITLEKSSDIE